jgi:16S rRNA (cytosine967-C5)-methyltransferase
LKFYSSHITSAKEIIQNVNATLTLQTQLLQFFKANKKIGSKDRKQITHYCYCYFRAKSICPQKTVEETIATGLFIFENQPNDALAFLNNELNNNIEKSLEEKLVYLEKNANELFAFNHLLSQQIFIESFAKSFTQQPNLFLRIRKNEDGIKAKLTENNISFIEVDYNCLCLPNSAKVTDLLAINEEVVIQDYSSQQVFRQLHNYYVKMAEPIKVWDCCAASGGKSILLADSISQKIQLTVSDVRESILANLKLRFKQAQIKNYNCFLHDATTSKPLSLKKQNIIICDVPCTGSGTWARTPEQHVFFKEDNLIQFTTRQFQIAHNVLKYLDSNGILVYITCSAFAAENEEIVEKLTANTALRLCEQYYIKGYENHADTMFVAILSLEK